MQKDIKLYNRFKSYDNFNNVFLHSYKAFYIAGTTLLWVMGESSGKGWWLLALVNGGW